MSIYMNLKTKIKDAPFVVPVKKHLINLDNKVCNAFGSAPDFVIAGTGRSGTVYMAHLLTELGVPTRHEYFYGPHGYNKRIGVSGEVSWLAVPYLDAYQGKVLHVTRSPLKVINALVSARAFDTSHINNMYVAFMNKHFPLSGNQVSDATKFYVEWNEKIERKASLRFKLEDITEKLPEIMQEIMQEIGAKLPKNYKDILERQPRRNSRSKPCVIFEDLPKGKLMDDLLKISARYGYELEGSVG